jgi:hypothetical protein
VERGIPGLSLVLEPSLTSRRLFALLSGLLVPGGLHAAELDWNGYYRARGLIYDSLSLSETNALSEGTSNLIDHRLQLEPRFILSERVGLFAQIDGLNLVPWGDNPERWLDPVTGEETWLAYDQTQLSPRSTNNESLASSIAVTRAWGEVYTGVGRLRFGRVPLHWGTGIFLNDGRSPGAEFGDTADRVQFTARLGPVHLMGAWDVQYEGYLNVPDDMQSLNAAVAWQTESAGVGFYNSYRYQPSMSFNAWTGDLWFFTDMGPARVDGEVVAVLGGGNLEGGQNDISIRAMGAMLRGEYRGDHPQFGIEAGLATGDANPNDATIKTFTFDRDHNVSLLLFEEPMPQLEAASANETNGGRNLDAVRTGEGIRNALYLRPHVGWRFDDVWSVDLAVLLAQAARLPEELSANKGYGVETDLTTAFRPYQHFSVEGGLGLFLPGKYFKSYEHTELGGGFNRYVLGGRLMGTVAF